MQRILSHHKNAMIVAAYVILQNGRAITHRRQIHSVLRQAEADHLPVRQWQRLDHIPSAVGPQPSDSKPQGSLVPTIPIRWRCLRNSGPETPCALDMWREKPKFRYITQTIWPWVLQADAGPGPNHFVAADYEISATPCYGYTPTPGRTDWTPLRRQTNSAVDGDKAE